MKPSDFKHIVKDSLREAFYTKKVVAEGLYKPKKLTIKKDGGIKLGILSKNTIPNEKEFRVSCFVKDTDGHLEAQGHIELSKEEVDELFNNHKFPDDVIRLYNGKISVVDLNGWPEAHNFPKQFNENLLLLEDCSREIELWLENKIETIEESMNVVVSGANYERTDRLDELVNYLQNTVVSPVLRTMTAPDQIEYFHKNSVGFWNILSADGSYYENPDADLSLGTINLYPGGITSILLRRIVVGILRQLKKLGIKWGQLKREPSGAYKISDVIRFPIISNGSKNYQGPPELNLTNVNAYQIFHNVLQFEGEHDFTMDAKELMERIETLAHDKGWIDKNIIKRTDSDWPQAERDTEEPVENPHLGVMDKIGNQMGGARMIGMGLDSEGIEQRLQAIWKIAKWAVDHGHKTISVG